MLGLETPTVIREPDIRVTAEASPAGDELRERVASLIGAAPISLDEIVREARAKTADVQIALLELELAGRIERHGGGLISLL